MENKKIKNATPNIYNEIHYRSKLETDCAKFFEDSKIPVEYEKHTYELIPKRVYLGEVFKPVTYTPDFVGESFIVECKGFPNDRWPVIKKLFIQYLETNHVNKKFFEIGSVSELKRAMILSQTNLTEEWKPVVGFGDLYEVSNYGRVKSICYPRFSPDSLDPTSIFYFNKYNIFMITGDNVNFPKSRIKVLA